MKLNKGTLNLIAGTIAIGAENVQIDVSMIEDEDDARAALSHLDILRRNVQRLQDELNAQLRG